MSDLTRDEAYVEMRDVFDTAWAAAGPVQYQNVRVGGIPPAAGTPWARLIIQETSGFQATLQTGAGNRRFRRVGTLTAQIFQVKGTGLPAGTDLGTIVRDAFEGVTSANGIIFRQVTVNEVGPSGDWFQTNVVVFFEYDQLK